MGRSRLEKVLIMFMALVGASYLYGLKSSLDILKTNNDQNMPEVCIVNVHNTCYMNDENRDKYMETCTATVSKEKKWGYETICKDSTNPKNDTLLKLLIHERNQKLLDADCTVFCEEWSCEPVVQRLGDMSITENKVKVETSSICDRVTDYRGIQMNKRFGGNPPYFRLR